MIQRSKTIYIIFATVALLSMIGVQGYLYLKGDIFASELEERGEAIDQLKISKDLDGDSKTEDIYLTTYKPADEYFFYLKISKGFFDKSELKLSGFENEVSFCSDMQIVDLSSGDMAICVAGYVGAHSQNIQLIRYRDNLTPISFVKDQSETQNIYSDAPNYLLTDLNQDGKTDIYLDYRDYDKNPIIDIIRHNYYLDGENFVYVNKENLTIEGSEGVNQGLIN